MEYIIQTIRDKSELENCREFKVDSFNWGGDYRPVTTGRLGYIADKGFWLYIQTYEENPASIYMQNDDPVYKDSAVEAFINFYPEMPGAGYVNFEMNSNGALLAEYGEGRQGRRRVSDMRILPPQCSARRENKFWCVELFIPLQFLYQVYGRQDFCSTSKLKCNFFKIKEGGELEHYASFAPVKSDSPNFHLPVFFADCTIADL